MKNVSARQFLGLPVITNTLDEENQVFGIIETVLIQPETMTVDGFLIGRMGSEQDQVFLPRECASEPTSHGMDAKHYIIDKPAASQRILGLSAWTLEPKFLVGLVYDVYFSLETGDIESFVIHQLIRTWRIPAATVIKITSKALIINNDTTIKIQAIPKEAA